MSNQPKYPPITAPLTPERIAAMKQIKQHLEDVDSVLFRTDRTPMPNFKLEHQKSTDDKATQLRDKFEEWILNRFYCPKGISQLMRNADGTYKSVAYNRKDSTKFSEIEALWQAYITGHCHL